jgi:tetratricopeptide (TPR) repeat protein
MTLNVPQEPAHDVGLRRLRAGVSGLLALLLLFTAPLSAQINFQAAQLEQEALDAFAAGDMETAGRRFEQALEHDPDSARLRLGAGAVAYRQQRYADARTFLEAALKLDPGLTTAHILLAQMRHQSGDLFGAIRTLETVVAADPDDTDSADTLDRWRLEFKLLDQMEQRLSDHFTVSYEGPPEAALAIQAVEALDRAYWRIGQELSLYPLRPIPVVLYTTEQFRDITRSPDWAAGSYDGTAIRVPMRGATDTPAELDRVLAHEFAHVLIREIAPRNVPAWLNEGLASALEDQNLGWAARTVERSAHSLSIETLSGRFDELSTEDAQLAYAMSALAVRRLLDEAGGIALANLLRDLGQGIPLDEAFRHRLYRPLDDFLRGGF